ncbi:MAG: cytoplasmic protein [Chloroflexia bacterium]|nr:cytoplasmic protein [Chloroflexia bacterium]
MNALYYSVADSVFEQFPGYVRGVVLAYEVSNGPSPAELVALLRAVEAGLRQRLHPEELAQHPRIASWREAYRSFGAKPNKYRSSVEALARRVLGGSELPSINALVDVGNLLSLRHLVPVGGHAIDVVRQDLALRPATGAEEFVAFGSAQVEQPLPGEIVFAEGNTVLTRRWTWRQAQHSLTLPSTRAIEFNVDGLPPVPPAEVEEICRQIIELVQRFCGGRARYEIIEQGNPRIRLAEG